MAVYPISLRRLVAALLVPVVLGLLAPAGASAFGALTQKEGAAGCVNDTGSQGCQAGIRIGGSALTISPDGKNVYATGFDSTSAVAVLDRDPLTGELTQKALPAGCNSGGGAGGCRSVATMVKPDGVAVSQDGKNAYIADFDQNSVMVFEREPDGSLNQLPAPDGCFSPSGHGGTCTVANGLTRGSRVVVSPDDENVYVASSGGGGAGAVAIFDRNLATGKLSQKPGAAGCVSADGMAPCAAAVEMGHPEGIAISPGPVGETVYVTARGTNSVLIFDRAADGGLTQLPSPDGCWDSEVNVLCGQGVGLANIGNRPVKSPAVSPDGKNVYVPASGGSVAVFDRNTVTGAIDQKDGLSGCISWDGTGGACQPGFGLREAAEVVVSPDGQSVYVAGGYPDSGVAVFDRDESNGELTQRSGKEGCISASGSGGSCETGRNLPAIAIAISPDDKNVYVGGIAVFDRDEPPPDEEPKEEGGGGKDGQPDAPPACPGDADCDGLPDSADVCPRAPGRGSLDGCPLRLDEVTPKSGGTGPVTLRLRGRGFQGDPTVKLVRAGQPEILAGSVSRIGAQALSVSFDLGDAKPGAWEVVVEQSDPGASARQPFAVVAGGPPVVRARLIGRGTALNGYPWSGILQVSNDGTTDARNALVRIAGFYSHSDATVLGGGATVTHIDSGRSQGLLVSIDRIPPRTTKMVLVRFTALGPGHSFYRLRPSVIASSLPKARPVDPSVRIVPEVKSSSASGESGAIHVTGGGKATYDVRLSDQNLGAPPSFKTIRSGDKIRIELSATMPAPATGPLGGASASDVSGLRRIKLSAESDRKTNGSVEVFQDLSGSYQLTISRKGVLDCLVTRRELAQAEYDNLVTQADGVFTAQLIKSGSKLAPGGGAAGQGVKFALSFGPDLMSANFEAHLARALRDEGAGDPNSPYFGMNHEEIVKLAYRNCLPDPPPPGIEEFSLEVLTPGDPNDKVGPAGFRGRRYVARGAQMPYLVMFENVPSASAPAHEVRITDQLDASKLDLSTLELGPVYFGDRVAAPPPGLQSWKGSIDLRPAKDLIVSVDADLNRATGLLTWHFRGLNPITGELETLPELGFLPPNKTSPEGQGGVAFTISQVPGLRHGTKIANGATIVFDREQPISTPVFVNRVDTRPPRSSISAAKKKLRPRRGPCDRVRLRWRGRDSGAGVALHDVLLSRNGSPYAAWRSQTKRRSGVFAPPRPGAYAFFSAATDGAGNAASRSGGAWGKLVGGVAKRRGSLVLSLRKGAAETLRIRSLQVSLDGKPVAERQGVPGRIKLRGIGPGGHKLRILARTKAPKGGKAGKLRAGRLVVFCGGSGR